MPSRFKRLLRRCNNALKSSMICFAMRAVLFLKKTSFCESTFLTEEGAKGMLSAICSLHARMKLPQPKQKGGRGWQDSACLERAHIQVLTHPLIPTLSLRFMERLARMAADTVASMPMTSK